MNKNITYALKENNIFYLANEPLSLHTSIKIGGICPIVILPEDENELIVSIKAAKKYYGGYYIMGKGTNILFKDDVIDKPVISLEKGFKFVEKDELNPCILKVGAGLSLSRLLNYAIKNNLEGCEFFYGIPGSLGGSIKMNAGSKENTIGNIIESIDVITNDGVKLSLNKENIEFSYRNINISGMNSDYFIVSAKILLTPSNKSKIFEKIEFFKQRKSTQPLGEKSLGCIFENPQGYFAGKIIDEIGFKGFSNGDAVVSEKHANFIINKGSANAGDIIKLIKKIQEPALLKKNIKLNTEIKII
jgi:UDP-N-acetylmuramate dehydrogenase